MPTYAGDTAALINVSLLDNLGLAYPKEDWTYRDAEALYRSIAKPNVDASKSIYRGQLWLYVNNVPDSMYFAPWGAALVSPNNPRKSGLDAPEMVAAVTCMADLVHSVTADWMLPSLAEAAHGLGFNFDLWPLPAGPQGGAEFGARQYYAISQTTKQPDAAWALLEYAAFQPQISRVDMRFLLTLPARKSLQEEYLSTVRQVAPPLRSGLCGSTV